MKSNVIMEDKLSLEKKLKKHISKKLGIDTNLGFLDLNTKDKIGQGANSVVFLGKINKQNVAVKFLISKSKDKINRFKAEFFNTNQVKNKLKNVVNMIHYSELELDEVSLPYIIMTPYVKNLKQYRKDLKGKITKKLFLKLSNFLFSSLKSIHDEKIIHRDIKPENILVDKNGDFFLSDFGIAKYNKNNFLLNNNTEKGDRLANIEFSAPEQINNKYQISNASDIYSMAQILYWFIFEETNKGTNIQLISKKFSWDFAKIYDDIINICLRNKPNERFQYIDDVLLFIKKNNDKINPFHDMFLFQESIVSIVPEFYNNVFCVSDKKVIFNLLKSIFSKKYSRSIEFNTGESNAKFFSFKKMENNIFVIDEYQLNIKKVWGLLSEKHYDDILLLELEKIPPYIIDKTPHNYVAIIEGKEIVPLDKISSGFVRYQNKVQKISNLKIEIRNNYFNNYNYVAIAPVYNSILMPKNDDFMFELQKRKKLHENDIKNLNEKIRRNIYTKSF